MNLTPADLALIRDLIREEIKEALKKPHDDVELRRALETEDPKVIARYFEEHSA